MSVSSSSWCCCSCCRPSVDQRGDARRRRVATAISAEHALVDLGAVALHLGQRRPRHQAALRPRILLADALVVAVEEHPEAGVEGPEAGLEALEQEGLEEPGDVREMPLGRARVGHRLHLAVLGRQRRDECQRTLAHGSVAFEQRSGAGGGHRLSCFFSVLRGNAAARDVAHAGLRASPLERRPDAARASSTARCNSCARTL